MKNIAPETTGGYRERADKIVEGEAVVADVCDTCNNGRLSELDKYICDKFSNRDATTIYHGDKRSFRYDYDEVLRWLLKVSYNSYRTLGADDFIVQRHRPYAQYIIDGGPRPTQNDVAVFLQLVPCYRGGYGNPIRIMKNKPGAFDGNAFARGVSIRGYFFWLLFLPGNRFHRTRAINKLTSELGACSRLYPGKDRVIVEASAHNAYHMSTLDLALRGDMYRQYEGRNA